MQASAVTDPFDRSEINFISNLVSDFCQVYQLASFTVRDALLCRNVLVIHADNELTPHEYLLTRNNPQYPHERRKHYEYVFDTASGFITESLNDFYKANIIHTGCRLELHAGKITLDIIAIFDRSLNKLQSNQSARNDQLAQSFARQMRDLTGRGPQRCRAVELIGKGVIYMIEGIMSGAERQFALAYPNNAQAVEDMAKHNIAMTLSAVHGGTVAEQSVNYMYFDVHSNCMMVMAFAWNQAKD